MLCESVCTLLCLFACCLPVPLSPGIVTEFVCIDGVQIGDIRVVTEHLVNMSAIDDADPVGSGSSADEENLLNSNDFNKQFVLCKIKDRSSVLVHLEICCLAIASS